MHGLDDRRSFTQANPSRSSSIGDEADAPVEPPSLTRFFADAALYKQVIVNPDRSSFYRASENETIQDFEDLVGRHLDVSERDLAGRFARLSVEDSTWFPDKRTLVEEPENFEQEGGLAEPESAKPQESVEAEESIAPRPATELEPTFNLTPERIVELLQQELGALAPDGEEKLILETDAALMQDVIILGVLHFTTHRVAFHASLLDEPSRSNDVIRAGPATIHRRGLHRKRRIWLEVSRDFVCTFPSAEETDRMRPLRSVLLSNIKEICVEDPSEPLIVRAVFDGPLTPQQSEACLEFDTVESARDWRREMQGAVFMYKRSLLATLQGVEDDADGVRISIPLQAIDSHFLSRYMETLETITLTLSPPLSPGSEDSASMSSDRSVQSVEFVAMPIHSCHDGIDAMINAKQKLQDLDKEDLYVANRKIIVDYGSLGFPRPGESVDGSPPRSREQIVCDAIGIGASNDVWMTHASIHGVSISSGYFVVTPEWIGFWSRSLTLKDQRYRVSISSIQAATPASASSTGKILGIPNLHITAASYHLVLDIQGNPSLRFVFKSSKVRNEAIQKIREYCRVASARGTRTPSSEASVGSSSFPNSPDSAAPTISNAPRAPGIASDVSARDSFTSVSTSKTSPSSSPSASRMLAPISRVLSLSSCKALEMTPQTVLALPKVINIPRDTLIPIPRSRFVCLTIGSRGDVQPYIALCLGLKRGGHEVTIVTHEEYKGWIESFGIGHRTAGGDPGMLMKLSVENKMFSPQFFKESLGNYRKWLDKLLVDAWDQCQDAQVLLESPYAMGGVHIAEALNIPYFRVCTMPWTKTTQFPHPFISPPVETSRFNSMSYVLFDNVFWAATSTQINRWRTQHLHLPPTDMSHLAQSKIPIIYNFSPSVVPKPLDWNDTCIESGYWFLDDPEGVSWTPPPSLVDFMSQARADNKPIVYIGFGSITVPNPHAVSEKIYQAVVRSGLRAIISKGWSARMTKGVNKEPEMPKECYAIDKIPHDWLFPRIDAALHHGGAGTTSASLRAGIPTLIKPWFGDQFFWASRVHKLGAGMRVSSLRPNDLASALVRATSDRIMKEKASIVGEKIRSEDGVHNALRFISIYLPKAIRTPAREVNGH